MKDMNAAAPSAGLDVVNGSADIFGGEAGIVKALAAVRGAAMPPEEKDRLRDLFLSYTGEDDANERESIKAEILAALEKQPQLSSLLGIKPEAPKVPAGNSLGRTRPAPSFAVVAPSPKPAPEEVKPTPEAVKPIPEPVKEPEVVAPPPPTPEPAKAPEVVAAPPPAPEPAPMAVDTNVKARIDAIKHDINGKVGNPVNLINADETIGREYMSALLSAMKQASVGGGAEALTRLDTAYQAALKLISEKGLAAAPATPAPKPEEPPKVEAVPAPVEPPPPPPPEPVPEIKPPPPPPVQSEGLYHRPSDELDQAEAKAEEKPSSFASRFFKSEEKKVEEKAPAAPQAVNIRKIEPVAEPERLKPLKDTATGLPEKMAELKAAGAKREAEAKKPITDLKSPEIEAGMRQLLSEWSLFKKSGFLGTGPSGIDHPLYKKLAGLPMAAVVSGRFEGVTPEIKRQLSDYMTGWRYEQGIMHEMGETFDNYLRRVIRQVLERQRTKATKES